MMMRRSLSLPIAACFLFVTTARAEEAVDYLKQVKPVLQERCFACHGVLMQKAGLRLDTAAFALKGGRSGPAFVPGKSAESLIVERVRSEDDSDRMPPEGEHLKPEQMRLLALWIDQGAKAPADEQAEPDPKQHWAFQAPKRPTVPTIADPRWNRNPIDAFIARDHQRQQLRPQPAADKRLWLRRVTLDLIGLPPTPAEIDAFLADTTPESYERVVDRLLSSPLYAERWARHWMDIWRYSDWWGLGAEVRNSQKHMWHWRDWIVESIEADKGYDQMLREMLAADEMYPNDLNRLRATGYLARQYFKFNRTTWLDETLEHTAKGMLGLTFNCAKCHDHKYDPFSQVEYYQLRAIFEPYQIRTEIVPGESDIERNGIPRAFDCNLDAKTFLHIRGDDRNPDSRLLTPGIPQFLSQAKWQVQPVNLPIEAVQPGVRPHIVDNYIQQAEQQIVSARAALAKAKQQRDATVDAPTPMPATPKVVDGKPIITDDFAKAQPDLWQMVSGDWKYENGKLKQSNVGTNRGILKLKKPLPENFEVKFRYQAIGGEMWKSIGIVFDRKGDHEVLAYSSAYSSGSKTQIAHKRGGADYTYPPESAQTRKIVTNQPYEMTLRVQGTLINLLIDGELSVAYRLPFARQPGELQLITFDAQALFERFELRELPADTVLAAAKNTPAPSDRPATREQAELLVRIAEKQLRIAEAQPESIRARAAAMKAKFAQPPSADAVQLAQQAARSERQIALLRAEEALLRADLAIMQGPSTQRTELDKKRQAATSTVEAARKNVETPSEAFTVLIGAYKTLESNLENEASRSKPFPTTSTGRRTAFAQWLTDRQNPLPARVAVNHIWLRHMGKPLVPTIFDFGRKGTAPTHPELLDWLAVEFVEHAWSMKHLHRLIVTSETYRLSSSSRDAAASNLERDRDNRYYWRGNPLRMEAQVVRDSLLHLAGELDLQRGGPPIPVNDANSKRRSLYFFQSHNEHQKFLSLFDDANVLDCYRRAESVVPQQALALENSPLASSMAARIAERIASSNPNRSDAEFIEQAFRWVLTVPPSADEHAVALEGLQAFQQVAKAQGRPNPAQQARTALILALLNHNDFITIR